MLNLVLRSASLDLPLIKILSKMYVTRDVSLVWNPFQFRLLNSCVSLISPPKLKLAWETTKSEPCAEETLGIEPQIPHFIVSQVSPLGFKLRGPHFEKVISSLDLWANNNNNNDDHNNNSSNNSNSSTTPSISCLIRNLFLNFQEAWL